MPKAPTLKAVAADIERRLAKLGLNLTLGGEPSFVPTDPAGAEWNITAVGPTKLAYAESFAAALTRNRCPNALAIFSPGKLYPGEVNPRWAIHLLQHRDGTGLLPRIPPASAKPDLPMARLRITEALGLKGAWHSANDGVWVLPLDHDGARWKTDRWVTGRTRHITLTEAEGPAGLRLPLEDLDPGHLKRALVLEPLPDGLHIFLPPLLQGPWSELLLAVAAATASAGIASVRWEGYLPPDESGLWQTVSFSPDPGVLEVNLPPCKTWSQYAHWIHALDQAAGEIGLRTFKAFPDGSREGTGGGNHLLFGGPSDEENPFFRHPGWIASILRFWQHHPSLSYLFTGRFVGPSSQAPRPDESGRDRLDLELACRALERLPSGTDHRLIIAETLRHLHVDASGNTHRSEISFDKFWTPGSPSGSRGLIEFRALESLPSPRWTESVALLWRALALHLAERPFRQPLADHAHALHDRFLLPQPVWDDLAAILRMLRARGLALDESVFREIWEWRFPLLLSFNHRGATLEVRRACETWPLLCETPMEGGTTSRFVDASMERLEFCANAPFARRCHLAISGRPLPLERTVGSRFVAGARYRKSALHPSLHPLITPDLPLRITISSGGAKRCWNLTPGKLRFEETSPESAPPESPNPCAPVRPGALTRDLRF